MARVDDTIDVGVGSLHEFPEDGEEDYFEEEDVDPYSGSTINYRKHTHTVRTDMEEGDLMMEAAEITVALREQAAEAGVSGFEDRKLVLNVLAILRKTPANTL